MPMEMAVDRNDALLRPLLMAMSETERDDAIAGLLSTHVYWRVDRILLARFLRSSLDEQHREDVRNEILLRLVDRLRRLADDPTVLPIESLPDYVSVVAFNAFDGFARQTTPMRARLRNRIRYALRHDRRLAMWETAGKVLCGRTEWVGRSESASVAGSSTRRAQRRPIAALLGSLFDEVGNPVPFDEVVQYVARVQGIDDRSRSLQAEPAAERLDPGERLADLQYLQKLWEEICALPLRQRIALLLNARDEGGESVMRFLPVVGVASIRQIGSTLAIDAEELAGLWPELPLEDTRIAIILQLTRQQVINLRRTARERLLRRMGKR
jgi:hypothetical protein